MRRERESGRGGRGAGGAPLVRGGGARPPLHVDFVMGIVGGVPPTARNLAAMADNVPAGSHWGVIGISRDQWRVGGGAPPPCGSGPAGAGGKLLPPRRRVARPHPGPPPTTPPHVAG